MSKKLFLEQNQKEGEIYAGLVLGKNGEPDHHVFLLAAKPVKVFKWQAALDWAKEAGGDLPTRNEQSLLFANLSEQFDRAWYWSNTQNSGYTDYAWVQDFSDGNQYELRKSNEYRARAVRRIYIQE